MTNNEKKLTEEVKELNENELSEVTGGSGGEGEKIIGNYRFSGHVNQFSTVAGNYYYFTFDKKDGLWGAGYLVRTTEEDFLWFFSNRIHVFNEIKEGSFISDVMTAAHSGDDIGKYAFYADDITLYTTRTKI